MCVCVCVCVYVCVCVCARVRRCVRKERGARQPERETICRNEVNKLNRSAFDLTSSSVAVCNGALYASQDQENACVCPWQTETCQLRSLLYHHSHLFTSDVEWPQGWLARDRLEITRWCARARVCVCVCVCRVGIFLLGSAQEEIFLSSLVQQGEIEIVSYQAEVKLWWCCTGLLFAVK